MPTGRGVHLGNLWTFAIEKCKFTGCLSSPSPLLLIQVSVLEQL